MNEIEFSVWAGAAALVPSLNLRSNLGMSMGLDMDRHSAFERDSKLNPQLGTHNVFFFENIECVYFLCKIYFL